MARYHSLDPEKYTKIRDAAIELFAENGVENTSISQIASKAGIAKGTLYLYFSSREELEQVVFDYCASLSITFSMNDVECKELYSEKLKQRTRNILTFSKNYPVHRKINQYLYKPVNQVGTTDTPFAKSYQINRDYIQKGMESGEFKSLPLDLMCTIFFSGVEGLTSYFTNNPDELDCTESVDTAIDMLIDSISQKKN